MALAYIGLRATSTTSVAIAGGKDASIATMKFTPDQYLARRAPYLLTADPDARASQTRGNLYALTCVQCSCRTGNRRTADPQLWYAPSYPSHWIARSSTGATPSRHANPFARRPNFEALQGQHGRRRDTDDEHKLRATRPSPKAQREVPRGSPRPLRAGWRRVWMDAERSRHARLRVPSEPDSCPSRVKRRSHPSVPPAAPPTCTPPPACAHGQTDALSGVSEACSVVDGPLPPTLCVRTRAKCAGAHSPAHRGTLVCCGVRHWLADGQHAEGNGCRRRRVRWARACGRRGMRKGVPCGAVRDRA